jgi:ubiquinone/menaquinone biosynthesis C-methylase UbiE
VVFHVADNAYDKFMGRYSVRLAPPFADFAGASGRVLDVGAGTGALTAELAGRGLEVAAIEPSPEFAAGLQARFPDVDDAPAGAREMRRVVKPGGVVAVCMWDRKQMQMFAAINRTREAVAPDSVETGAENYRTAADLAALLSDAGLEDVETDALEVEASYTGFDDFWLALAGGVGPAGQWLKRIEPERQGDVRAEMFRQLGEPSGEFTLSGTAWAARGRA